MTSSAGDVVIQVLGNVRPEKIILIGDDAPEVIQPWLDENTKVDLKRFADAGSFLAHPSLSVDWALVSNCLETLSDQSGSELLGRLRNLSAPKFCVLVEDDHCVWNARSLTGFALEKLANEPLTTPSGRSVRAFGYDVATYKQTPDWLNSDYWANPGRWDKDFW